jgi:hypothetical protein
MKINSDFTKTLLSLAAKTTIDKLASNSVTANQEAPQDSTQGTCADANPESPDGPTEPLQEPFGLMLKSIGIQVAAAVTDRLFRQMDKKVEEIVHVAEVAVQRQRVDTLREIQSVLQSERTKAIEDLQKAAASISNKGLVSAAFIGGSLLVIAASFFIHK